jgi:threonine 3-dehydrogenase
MTVITGAGPIGVMAAALARHLGARHVVMSGVPAAIEDMLGNMNHGGRVAMLGLPSAPYSIDWGV